jgi:hypothetical protein
VRRRLNTTHLVARSVVCVFRSGLGLALLCLLVGSLTSGFAQTRDTAAIFGAVTDQQGAAIPGALLNLTHTTTGQVRTTHTSAVGEYSFNLLPIGVYSLTVETPSFRRYERTGITIQANENAKVDVVLELGDVKSTVSVAAAATQVETRSMTIGETVDQARIDELPLNGRNSADLALLTPGVVSGESELNGEHTQAGFTMRGEKTFSINGSRNDNVLFTLDGGDNVDRMLNFGAPFPFPDAVQEFSVQSSNTSFDHGSASSGAINIVTKSGTNQIHGDVFWFVRNTDLDASSFFSHQQDQLKQNQAGFTVGGPILKNKLFAFGGFEKLEVRTASGASRALSMDAAERAGNFSGDAPITDPLTGQPFPGNIIPASRLSPAALNVLKLAPLPGPDGFADYTYAQPEHDFQYILRGDYVLNEKNNLTFRYFQTGQSLPYHSPSDDIFAARTAPKNSYENGTVAYNFIASPNLIAHTQATINHMIAQAKSDFPTSIADLGVAVYAPSNDISVNLVNSGIGFSAPPPIYFARATEEFVHDWTWTKGKHTLTWGTRLSWSQYNEYTVYNSSGLYQFDGYETGLDRADFMLGQMSFFTQNNGEFENRRQPLRGFYFGDVWRLTPRFTVSLGLRYEPYTFFTDTQNRNQTFSPQDYYADEKSKVYLNAPPGLLYYGDVDSSGRKIGKSVIEPDLNNWGPRLGIAWDPFGDGKTSVRMAYGIYYDQASMIQQNNSNDVAPFSYEVSFNNGLFDNPYAGRESANVYPVTNLLPTTPFQSPLFTIVLDKRFNSPYTQNYNFTVERQVFKDTRVRIGYVGTKATHLQGEYNENPPIYDPSLTLNQNIATINDRRQFTGYQDIIRSFHGLNSNFNALQISVDKRFSNGFTILGFYSWAKTLDYTSINIWADNILVQNPFNFFFRRGPADQNVPQRFVTSFVWDLPIPHGEAPLARAILRDWKLSGILTLQSGLPFNINANADVLANGGTETAYVDLIGSGSPVVHASSKGAEVAEYFNTARFAEPAVNTYGTLGRNAMIGPGYSNMDTSLVKGFRIPFLGEAGLGQLRFEAFNVFNRTNFGQPVTDITSPAFGQLTTTIGNARLLQIAAKIRF